MQRGITTKLTVYHDSPVSISSTVFGANLNCIAFNADYIGSKNPELVREVFRLYEKCKRLRSR